MPKPRRNFTLSHETIAWLERQPNMSQAIDDLVADEIVREKRRDQRFKK